MHSILKCTTSYIEPKSKYSICSSSIELQKLGNVEKCKRLRQVFRCSVKGQGFGVQEGRNDRRGSSCFETVAIS